MPLDQGTSLAAKLSSGCRPNNALSRLGSPPGGWVRESVVCITTTVTITVTVTITFTIPIVHDLQVEKLSL